MRIRFPRAAAFRGGLLAGFGLAASVAPAGPLADGTHPFRASGERHHESAPGPSDPAGPDAFRYASLHAIPLPELKAALERAGWPATHVRAFVEAEIQARLNPPQPPRADELRPFEFWRTGPDAEPLSPATLRERETLRAQREAAVRDACERLLPAAEAGADLASPALDAWNERREWGELTSEKRARVAAALADAARARDALLQPRGGQLAPAEWETVLRLAAQSRAALARILTPAELLDHDLRASSTANRLRRELDAFAPTRDEFLAIFRLRHAHDLRFAVVPRGAVPALEAERAAADAALDRALAHALGAERFADYRLSLEPGCQTLMFDGRFAGADAATVRRLYRATLAARARRGAPGLTATELAAVKNALFREFRAVFDEEAARRFLHEQELWP